MPLINPQRNGFGRDLHTNLQIRFASASAPDVSHNAFTVTATNMTYSTNPVKFSPYAGLFSSSRLDIADNVDLRFGTGPWTIDFWCYFTATPATNNGFMCKGSDNTSTQWSILWNAGLVFYSNSTAYANTGTANWATNTWHHVAFVYDKTNLKSYVDGLLRGTSAFSQNLSSTTGLSIGRRRNSQTTNTFTGSMDEIRISKGIVRWESAFKVPNRGY